MPSILLIAFVISNLAFIVLGYVAIKLQTRHNPLRFPMWIVVVLGGVSLALRYYFYYFM